MIRAAQWPALLLGALLLAMPELAMSTPTRAAMPPASAPKVAVRLGNHGTYGRVVFLVPAGVSVQMTRDGDTLRLALPGAGAVPGTARGTVRVLSVAGGSDAAVLVLAPDSRPVLWQSPGKVVVDVYPLSSGPVAPPSRPPAAGTPPAGAAGTPPAGAAGTPPAGAAPGAASTLLPVAPAASRPPAGRPGTIDGLARLATVPNLAISEPTISLEELAARARLPAPSGAGSGTDAATRAGGAVPGIAPLPDPSTTGPSTTGPSTTGPSTTGPSTTGPSTAASSTNGSVNVASSAGPSATAASSLSTAPVADPSPVNAAPVGPAEQAPADAAPADGLVAARVPPEQAGGGDAILVPFDRDVSAAAFPRDGLAHVVFDDSKPVDLSQLKDDPVFGGARITLLPAATQLTLALAAGKRVRLHRRADGWVVAVVPQVSDAEAAPIDMKDGVIAIGTPHPADTVVIDDPSTRERMLVGTVRAEGAAVAAPHVSAEFSLLPTWAGVLVAADSDRLMLRAGKGVFSLAMASNPKMFAVIVPEAEQGLADSGTLTRHFELTPLPTPLRLARLTTELGAAARAPKLERFPARLHAAQDMIALCLDREAGALLRIALQDEPEQAGNADAQGLLAMADWFAGRGDGAALNSPKLGTSDEMALWRALLQPNPDGHAAATLADTWRLLLAYPEPMRHRLLPMVADILLKGGERPAAEALLARVPDRALDRQRALALSIGGKIDEALALLDRVQAGRDRRAAAAALRDGVELRLAAGKITPLAAADSLDKHLFAWRDDALEATQRLRIAALRSQAGAWRPALALLRETEVLYPAARERAHAAEVQVITALLASSAIAKLPPLDLVALIDENADLLAAKGASENLAPLLVEKLMALDLPDRVDPILNKLMIATDQPAAKAVLGAQLAALRLDEGDSPGAKQALSGSDADGLQASLAMHRTVLQARALVLDGTIDDALRLLAPLDDPEALDLQARLLEKRRDWHGAEAALAMLARRTIPATGALSDVQQDLVLRLASAAAEAGDMALMQLLQSGNAARLSPGPRAQLFQALATRPVQAVADLPRSGREAIAAGAVPAALASYDTH